MKDTWPTAIEALSASAAGGATCAKAWDVNNNDPASSERHAMSLKRAFKLDRKSINILSLQQNRRQKNVSGITPKDQMHPLDRQPQAKALIHQLFASQ
jgi:hypothetical protein